MATTQWRREVRRFGTGKGTVVMYECEVDTDDSIV